jgi:hypothetical protein
VKLTSADETALAIVVDEGELTMEHDLRPPNNSEELLVATT